MSLILLIALYLFLASHPFGPSANLDSANLGAWTVFINCVAWVTASALMGVTAWRLHDAANPARIPSPMAPLIMTLLYGSGVGFAHVVGWVPIPLAAAILSPIVFMPPLLHRAVPRPVLEAPLFTFQEQCRIRESASNSALIQAFLSRYPNTRVYVYRNDAPYSCGGLMLHNTESMPLPQKTLMEVTLECPFTQTPGILTPGREILRAYFSRTASQGSIVSVLPQTRWEEWLEGMQYLDWMATIREMDGKPATHPPLKGIPYQLIERNVQWRTIIL